MSQTTESQVSNFELYRYVPSLAAAITSVIVFAVLSAGHIWKLYRHRTLYFTAFCVGGLFETVGYCGRIWGHFDQHSLGGFIIQSLLILVAPALYAASIYMILGRLIRVMHAETLSIIPIRWMTKIFVAGDVFSFLLQGSGGGIQATGTVEAYNTGEKLIVAGLITQIVFFGFFISTAAVVHARAWKQQLAPSVPWQRHLFVLYTVSLLILVRSIFRVVEYLQGNAGYLISHEVFLYIFDMMLMSAAMIVLLIWYVDGLTAAFIRADWSHHTSAGYKSAHSDDLILESQ